MPVVSCKDDQSRVRLTECPLDDCETTFDALGQVAWHYYSDHSPEDFGLSPLRGNDE